MASSISRFLKRYVSILNGDCVPRRPRPEPDFPPRPRKETPRWVHLLLFLLTFLTTTLAGAGERDGYAAMFVSGLPFSLTLMTILLFHEMGHYLAARRFGLKATLPYFIPMPHWISPIGTLGAVIRLKSPMEERRALLWVGAAGPLAGFVVSLAAVISGIRISEVLPLPVLTPGSYAFIFGDSFLFRGITHLIHGAIPPGHDIFLSPMAWAGWIGFLVTSLNLMPLGQLDGGHILHALIGRKQVRAGWAAFIALVALSVLWPGWIVWILMTLFFLRVGHPVLYDPTPLGALEKTAGWSCIIILLLTFIPAPVDLMENDSIFPLECPSCAAPLEPSGIARAGGKLIAVSDGDAALYEIVKGVRGRAAMPWAKVKFSGGGARFDFEGLAFHENQFFIADERGRRIIAADASGKAEVLPHDIADYNRRNGIRFSRDANAGFEGIAVDAVDGSFYILNERAPAVIYRLEKNDGMLKAVAHLDLGAFGKGEISDASDIFAEKGNIYVLARKANRIIKLGARDWSRIDHLDFTAVAARLYVSADGYGFAEGLCIDENNIYLTFESDGHPLRGSTAGKHGTLVIMSRPRGF